jgi:hypothetical protein
MQFEAPEELDHGQVFEDAWKDSSSTSIELPPVDVNQVLSNRYSTSEPVTFTRNMMWDLEVRKAWRPDRYIPSVVRDGTAMTWAGRSTETGNDQFTRASKQRTWLDPEEVDLVLERCHVDMQEQMVTFIGVDDVRGPQGRQLESGSKQPLFHVIHSVDGQEDRPLNRWRIVHLTEKPDPDLVDRFERMAEDPWLPEYVEIYLRKDLNVELIRQE